MKKIVSLTFAILFVAILHGQNKSTVNIFKGKDQYFIISDRNVGSDIDKPVALNYTNNKRNYIDNENKKFKGSYYTFAQIDSVCPKGWRVPSIEELMVVRDSVLYSTDGVDAFFGSGGGYKSYLPLSGYGEDPSAAVGYYWSNTMSDNHNAFYLGLIDEGSYISDCSSDYELSVRCIKDINKSDYVILQNNTALFEVENVDVNGNSSFIWSNAVGICPDTVEWRLPTRTEMEIICGSMVFSNGKAFLRNNTGAKSSFNIASYWSGTADGDDSGQSYSFTIEKNKVRSQRNSISNTLSVRCVRTIEK